MRSLATRKRIIAAVLLTLAALGCGYLIGVSRMPDDSLYAPAGVAASSAMAIAPSSIRVLYSLDAKENDKEIIRLIAAARDHIYFAMYEFTLTDIADALVAAKKRGVAVYGLVDAGESVKSYDAPVIAKLRANGIPVETEHHADGSGIMHIKAIVTDSAYALGSYNWTASATKENDELLEIGTDPSVRKAYESILKRLFDEYGKTAHAAPAPSGGVYDYTEAPAHIGEHASVHGVLIAAYVSASGTLFLDFCKRYDSCPFSSVIFADDAKKFGDLSKDEGRAITVTGLITSYNGRAEIKLSDPSQLAITG